MRCIWLLGFVLLVSVSTCVAKDLIVGSSYNARLGHQHKSEYMAIPFKKRVKEMFYSDPSQQIIKGIISRDLDHTEGSAIITAGGVGFSYVNIRFKSERGSGINYITEIYV